MKRILLMLATSLMLGSSMVQNLKAQTNQGDFVLTGASQLAFQSTFSGGESEFTFSLTPSFGYFVADNIALGMTGSVLYNSTSGAVIYSAMPGVTYYINMGRNFIPYIGAQIGYTGASSAGTALNGLGLGVSGGGLLMVNDHVGVGLGLQYLHSRYFVQAVSIKANTIAMAIGLTTFF